jgi:hypothetical protein
MKNLAQALSKMQGQMTPAIKDATNPAFKSKYADLASVWEAIRKPLSDNGLSVTQQTDVLDNGQMILITTVWHMSGESLVARYPLTPAQNTIQAVGSCLSYARRYSISALLGVTQDDDDGNAGSGTPGTETAAKSSKGVTTWKPPAAQDAKKPAGGSAAPVDAAQTWAKNAARALQDMRSADEVDAWLAAAADKLDRLKAVSPALHDSLMSIASTTHEALQRREAAE